MAESAFASQGLAQVLVMELAYWVEALRNEGYSTRCFQKGGCPWQRVEVVDGRLVEGLWCVWRVQVEGWTEDSV